METKADIHFETMWEFRAETAYVSVKCRDILQPTAGFFQRCVGTIYSYKSGVLSEMSGQFAADNWQHITAHKLYFTIMSGDFVA